jgi:hypothetical protein
MDKNNAIEKETPLQDEGYGSEEAEEENSKSLWIAKAITERVNLTLQYEAFL